MYSVLFALIFSQAYSTAIISNFTIHNHVSFLNQRFLVNEWAQIKTIIKCWTNHGQWEILNRTVLNPLLTYEENFHQLSPCYKYTKKQTCYHILDGNATTYKWQTQQNQCSHHIKPIKVSELCKMKHLGNILILGDSMNEMLMEVFKNHIVRDKLNNNQTCDVDDDGRLTIQCNNGDRSEQIPLTITGVISLLFFPYYSN